MNKVEEWRDIEGYEGLYQVSNLGRVKSLKPRYKNKIILKQEINHFGYLQICLSNPRKTHKVHRLVAQAFIPNPENKPQVNHIDGNKLNNKVENLEWNTAHENNLHACRTGLNGGAKKNTSKLTEEQVIYIRNNYKAYDKYFGAKPLCNRFNISSSSLFKILNKTNYKLIGGKKVEPISKLSCEQKKYIKEVYIPFDKEFGLSALSKKFNVSIPTIQKVTGNMKQRITKEDAEFIRKNYKPRDKEFGCKKLSEKFKVNERTISRILNNKIDEVV